MYILCPLFIHCINTQRGCHTLKQNPHLQNGTKVNMDYGLAIWGCVAASTLAVIQRYQAKTLRQITDVPWYVTNHTLHTDLRIPPVRTVFQELAETHRTALTSHPNPVIAPILAPPNRRRLQRRWTLDVNS